MNRYKHIAIMVAMEKELNLLFHQLDGRKSSQFDNYTVHTGVLYGVKVTALKCGIGKVNATIATMSLLQHFPDVELVVNTGVAGGADTRLGPMDVVFGEQIAYHDVWCGPGTIYGKADGFPLYFNSSLAVLDSIDWVSNPNYHRGLICTGEQFINEAKQITEIKRHFPEVMAVDMESAAIAHVCYMRHKPFVSVRVISDSPWAGKSSIEYEDFFTEAPHQTFNVINDILKV